MFLQAIAELRYIVVELLESVFGKGVLAAEYCLL